MTEWIEQDKKDENHLYVHLKDPSKSIGKSF